MPSRVLSAEQAEHGRVRLRLGAGGPLSEAEATEDLTAILYASDPALDHQTGRLIPGKKKTDITTNLFLTEPDANGVSHLGGIECEPSQVELVVSLAKQKGYRVDGSV